MLSIDFKDDGRVMVYASKDGDSINATADANKIAAMLPASTLEALRERMAAFLDLTHAAPSLRKVN